MAIQRADKKKSIDKATASLAMSPLQSERELAKNIGVGNGTAHRAKKEVEQNGAKDDRIISLTDKDFELMQIIQKRKFERMSDNNQPVSDSDINNWDKEAKARYTIFRGEATDDEGGLKDMNAIDKLNSIVGGD